MKYADLTHKIIGCAMEVHNFLGNGFQKVIYQRYFVVELDSKNTSFYRKVEA
jgi:GxxExxY protein